MPASLRRSEERQQLLARLLLGHDAIKDVGPVETRQETLGVLQVQAGDDFFAGTFVGSGRQSDARHVREQLGQLAQLQVFRTEIVTPLRNAVGFVDGEQRNLEALQKRQHARLNQAFRRQIEHLHFAQANPVGKIALLFGAQRGVQRRRGNAQLFEGGDLIVHQCDQRRHHHCQAIAQQRQEPGNTGTCRHR
jgi:hypothetical protein